MANILAVDDNLELCKLIRTALERDGHRVETRQAGGALTEPLCRWADCILLDVMMPGEDGFAVCRRIRSLTDVPILFLSARTDEAAVLEGLGIGADDFLSKPFRVAELRARVAAHLRRQNRTPPATGGGGGGGGWQRPERGGGGHSAAADPLGVCHLRVSGAARWADLYQGANLRSGFWH